MNLKQIKPIIILENSREVIAKNDGAMSKELPTPKKSLKNQKEKRRTL